MKISEIDELLKNNELTAGVLESELNIIASNSKIDIRFSAENLGENRALIKWGSSQISVFIEMALMKIANVGTRPHLSDIVTALRISEIKGLE